MGKEKTNSNGNSPKKKNNKNNKVEEKKVTEKNNTKANNKKKETKNSKKKEEKVIEKEQLQLNEVIEEESVKELDNDLEDDFDEDLDEDFDDDFDDDLDEDFDDDVEDNEDEILNEKETVQKAKPKKEEINNDEVDDDEGLDADLDDDLDEDFDDDFDDEDTILEENNDDTEEVIIKEVPKAPKKKDKKESKKNIERIEKIAKEKKKKAKTKNNSKLSETLLILEKYRYPIYTFIAGVLITIFVVILIWPDRIATLKNGTQPVVKVDKKTYTADDLYENMKNYYSVSLLLDQIDTDILTKIYPEDDAMSKKIKENAEYYLNMYKQYYNYTQEEFLEKNGFSSYDAFLNYLRLDYRRNKYLDDYVEKNLTDKEIEKYYNDNVFGDINTQHVLVEVKSSDDENSKKLSDEDAKKLAEEIINKINDGTSWDKIKKDYKDKVTFEDLGYQSWDASLEETFMTALKEMENNSFSKEPVKTSYGYHVIYRLDQKKKPTLKASKEKIIEKLVSDKKSDDSNLQYKALISLREEKKIKFSDTVMKSKYEKYCKQYQK